MKTGAIALALLVVILFTTTTAQAQTVVPPSDVREILNGTTLSLATFVGSGGGEYRLFFEFNLSAYPASLSATFKFTGTGSVAGPIFLQPMTGGEDGTVVVGDWSLLGSPIWSGTIVSGTTNQFTVPVTAWFAMRAGGFGGFALTNGQSSSFLTGTTGTLTLSPAAIPEPGTLALFGFGLASLFVGYRSRRKRLAA